MQHACNTSAAMCHPPASPCHVTCQAWQHAVRCSNQSHRPAPVPPQNPAWPRQSCPLPAATPSTSTPLPPTSTRLRRAARRAAATWQHTPRWTSRQRWSSTTWPRAICSQQHTSSTGSALTRAVPAGTGSPLMCPPQRSPPTTTGAQRARRRAVWPPTPLARPAPPMASPGPGAAGRALPGMCTSAGWHHQASSATPPPGAQSTCSTRSRRASPTRSPSAR